MRLPRIALSLVTLAAALPVPLHAEGIADAVAALGGEACEAGALTCVTFPVPLDPRANDPDATIDLTFAVSLASEESLGVLFYAVGGPGGSGLAVADDYLGAFDASLAENLDVIFFDQRGIGPDHGLACPAAQAVFDAADMPLGQPQASIAAAQTYVRDCTEELDAIDLLPFVGTGYAAQDLEAFRQALGAPKVWIYGESYGSQLAQQYATAYPDAVEGVILDGVVDLNLSFEGFYSTYVQEAEAILARTLAACDAVPACGEDVPGDAEAAFAALSGQLDTAPVDVIFPLGDGSSVTRHLSRAMLETDAFYALYGPDDRAAFLRALASASRGELLPLLRLSYDNLGLDHETQALIDDPSWFGAAYFAITCADYADPGATPEARMDKVLADAGAMAAKTPNLMRFHFAERLVCANWPVSGPVERPQPFAGGDYPTLVLNADADPITPLSMAQSVFNHVRNGYLVTMQGGPHVIWGRGLACPDQIVADLIFDGIEPAAVIQTCRQDLIGYYEPLTMTGPDDADDKLELARSLETELYYSPGLYAWDGESDLSVGCDFGGTVSISAADAGTAYSFSACEWWKGLVIDGNGLLVENDDAGDGLSLEIEVSGSHSGSIRYQNSFVTEAMNASGSYK